MTKSRFIIQRHDKVSQTDDTIIESEGLTIGRLISNDLVLNHRSVSRTHAGIKEIAGQFWIFNLSASNGTLLNGQLAARVPISDGDSVQIGPYLLRMSYAGNALSIAVEIELDSRPVEGRTVQLQLPAGAAAEEGTILMNVAGAPQQRTSAMMLGGTGVLQALLPALDEQALDVFWEKRKREAGKIDAKTPLRPKGTTRTGKAQLNWTPTLDLRRLWRKSYFSWGVIIAAVFAMGAMFYVDAYSPGTISDTHVSTEPPSRQLSMRANGGSCTSCHGVLTSMQTKCSNCHSTANFQPAVYDAHKREGITCASCHSEHQGRATEAGLISYGICSSCHNGSYRVRTGERAGAPLPIPHGGEVGYPVANNAWKWRGLSEGEWQKKGVSAAFANYSPRDQFHLIHQKGAMQSRIRCTDCHTGGVRGDQLWRETPRDTCIKCHGVAFDVPASRRTKANCNSCHQQHGQIEDLAKIIPSEGKDQAAVAKYVEGLDTGPIDAGSVTGGAGAIRQERAALTLATIKSVGGLSWYVWLAIAAMIPLAGVAVMFAGAARARNAIPPIAVGSGPKQQTELLGTMSIDLEKLKAEGPPYPHPVIDPVLCIGCHACVEACPHDVLAIVNGISTPIALDQCMEDTSCQVECPTNPKACIVINTTKVIPQRKVPARDSRFMTNVPGIYLIGDVSGVPLIKNAINEGAQVIDHITEELGREPSKTEASYDVAVIGIGPAGLSAAVIARQRGLRCIAIEQDKVASTIANYPAGKYVFFKPDTVEPHGGISAAGAGDQKEKIIESWMTTMMQTGLKVNEDETCKDIKKDQGFFNVITERGKAKEPAVYAVRRVILAIGNRGTPMKLKVPGEELKVHFGPNVKQPRDCPKCGKQLSGASNACPHCGVAVTDRTSKPYTDEKVKYKLTDPADYSGKKCIIVGAGNSAIEAAVDLCGLKRSGNRIEFVRDNDVTLVIRSDFKGDLKLGNKINVYDCMDAGRLKVLFRTEIKEIKANEVVLMDVRAKTETARLANDYVFALIGGDRPTRFLEGLGIKVG